MYESGGDGGSNNNDKKKVSDGGREINMVSVSMMFDIIYIFGEYLFAICVRLLISSCAFLMYTIPSDIILKIQH